MCGFAVADGTATTTAAERTAQTPRNALNSGCLRLERRDPPAQTLLEIDLGLPTENLARTRDVRSPDLRIVDRPRLERDLAGRPGHADHRLRELEHRHLALGIPDVHGQVLTGLRERDETADGVVHVTEAAGLRAVAKHGQRLSRKRLIYKRHRRASVVLAHARPVRVEDARDRRIDALLVVIRHRQRLPVALRLVVDAARAHRIDIPPVALGLRMHERVAVDLARRSEQEPRALVLGEAE